jgi:hypothetical protein
MDCRPNCTAGMFVIIAKRYAKERKEVKCLSGWNTNTVVQIVSILTKGSLWPRLPWPDSTVETKDVMYDRKQYIELSSSTCNDDGPLDVS